MFAASLAVILAITIVAIFSIRRRPYLFVGWLWFLGLLIPVLGLVQVGEQARADRYTYTPLIGIFIAVVWWLADITKSKRWTIYPVVVVLLALAIVTEVQLSYWRDSQTLWTHALQVTRPNYRALDQLAMMRVEAGDPKNARELADQSLRINPRNPFGYTARARAFDLMGKPNLSVPDYRTAMEYTRDSAELHNNLASALATMGQAEEAEQHFRRAIELDPALPSAHRNYGILLAKSNRINEAISHWQESLKLNPNQPDLAEVMHRVKGQP